MRGYQSRPTATPKRLYIYRGAVYLFDDLVASDWKAQTYASSEKQAANNLKYQFKKYMGYSPNVSIRLAKAPQLATPKI